MTPPAVAPTTVHVSELAERAGSAFGHSSWQEITQDDVTAFARLTGDEQWIHVDPDRAAAGPFGTTIAHGYFTLALSTRFIYELVNVEGAGMVLNYGSDRVRYPAPVAVGSRVRALVELPSVTPVPGGVQVTFRLTYEVEGQAKPGCVADIVFRYYEKAPGRGAG